MINCVVQYWDRIKSLVNFMPSLGAVEHLCDLAAPAIVVLSSVLKADGNFKKLKGKNHEKSCIRSVIVLRSTYQ